MDIKIKDKNYKLYTEVIKGKNVIAYLELSDILKINTNKFELLTAQAYFLYSFLNNKISVSQILKNINSNEIDEYTTVLFNYLHENIDHKLIKIFKSLDKKEIKKEKSAFDDYDKDNGYEDSDIKEIKKEYLKDIIYSIYDYGTQNGNSFQDMNENINFINFLDYFDFIVNRKPKEKSDIED